MNELTEQTNCTCSMVNGKFVKCAYCIKQCDLDPIKPCDCLSYCGDDKRLFFGTVSPCADKKRSLDAKKKGT